MTTEPEKIYPPWSDEEVVVLRAWQNALPVWKTRWGRDRQLPYGAVHLTGDRLHGASESGRARLHPTGAWPFRML